MPATRRRITPRSPIASWRFFCLAVGLAPTLAMVLAMVGAAPARAALSATSEACLRRCLSSCADKGRAEDEACLRPCLKECPVHCGTVDTDCALAYLKKNPPGPEAKTPEPLGDPWEASSRRSPLAERVGLCAEACLVKPVCLPSAYDQGPPELTSSPKKPQPPAPAQQKRYEPKGRYFSLDLPQGWTVQEQDTLAKGGDFELTLLAKGQAFLDYSQMRVRYVPGPHRTAARFRFDLEHPAHGPANATAPVMTRTDVGGEPGWSAETRGERSLLGQEDSVPLRTRTLLLPRDSGYFVLSLDTPEAAAEANAEIFERMIGSFRPQAKAGPRAPELSAHERAVWAGFFGSGGKLEQASAPDAPPFDPGLSQQRQYLTDTARTRLVAGRTLAAPGIHKDALAELLRGCGAQDTDKAVADLAKAWDAVRGQQVLVTDEILLPGAGQYGLRVLEDTKPESPGEAQPELMGGPGRQGRLARPSGPEALALRSSLALLSRVALSPGGDLALAYVAHRQSSPGTSHFVLLRRVDAGWVLCGAAQKDMIIY